MVRKLRLKFIALSMTLVTLLFAVVAYALYASARDNLERISSEVLRRVIKETPSQYEPSIGGGGVVLPYFTVNVWRSGGAEVTGGTYRRLQDTDLLAEIINECLAQASDKGRLAQYGLRYLRHNNGLYLRIAFVDMSMEIETLRKMIPSQFKIVLVALLPLLCAAAWLSHWAVAPAEKAWRQQRQFLSDASHELKTPLTVILSNAELLEAADLPERPRRWTEHIHAEAGRMKTLVEEMLSLARADDAVRKPIFGEVSWSDTLLDCALSFEPVAFEAGKPLAYDIAPGVTVSGDADKLRRLASILLDNAIKYGAPGGAVGLTLERTDRQARLTVSNPGPPIPPETLSRLFERFYRGDASRGESSGFGLGLSIADAIAREHHGIVRVESDERSTRFSFALPLARPQRKPNA